MNGKNRAFISRNFYKNTLPKLCLSGANTNLIFLYEIFVQKNKRKKNWWDEHKHRFHLFWYTFLIFNINKI